VETKSHNGIQHGSGLVETKSYQCGHILHERYLTCQWHC